VPDEATYRPTAGERVAAAGSLVTVAAAAALALIGAVLNFIALLIAIVGLLVCVTAGWYAVSRRGAIRIIGLIVVVVALAAMITGLVLDDFSALRLLLVIVVAAVSVLLARYALRTSRSRLRTFTELLTPVAPAKHPVLIMNLKSGGGKAEKFRLADECRKRGIEPIILQPGDDLLQLADGAIDRGADVIGMAGGDGSQALVATVASRRHVPHVCIPAGTRNHFALDLGLNRDDVVGALDAFSDGVERAIDLAKVNGRVFVNNASLGLYAKVVQSPEYRDAKLKTATTMLPEMLGPDASALDLRYRGPDGTDFPTAHLILVSNDPYQLDHIGGRGTRERLDAGLLGILAARIADAADARRFVALEAAGQVSRFPGWQEWNAPRFEVGSGGPVEIGIDGEALLMDPPLVFESLPRALRVRLPRHAVRPSPAARTVRLLEGSTISELGRVAAGRPAALTRSSSRP
jgi:diacylglycerol kinase family enzyme